MFSKATILSLGLLASTQLVAGHSVIIKAVGDQGGQGSAIGMDPNTPRDGTKRNPFQQDSTRFKGAAADTCGETVGAGANDIQAGTQKVLQMMGGTLPQVSPGGQISMTLHQVNADGAGPYTCMVDASGTGTQWVQMTVTQNVDGNARGRNNANSITDLPLNVQMPQGTTCNGNIAGQPNTCLVRCQNPARAGPFGGCVPVQMAGGAAAGGAAGAAGAASPAAAGAATPSGAASANGAAAGASTGASTGAAAGGNTASTGATTGAAGAAGNTAASGASSQKAASASGATPQLTNDDQEEEVTKRAPKTVGGVSVSDDDEEEEIF